jgi:NADH-quinone oxidoreductase subunit E
MIAQRKVLTDEMVAKIEALMPRYPTKQALTLPALHIVHDELRQVPLDAVVEIAQLLDLAPAEVQDTLTFYQFFHQEKPHGKVRAFVCRSISCALRGGEQVLDHLCTKAGIKPGETTPDGSLTIEPAECLGACDFAPCMLAGDDLHKDLTPEKADQFLNAVRGGAS